jgi:hypothetical protein
MTSPLPRVSQAHKEATFVRVSPAIAPEGKLRNRLVSLAAISPLAKTTQKAGRNTLSQESLPKSNGRSTRAFKSRARNLKLHKALAQTKAIATSTPRSVGPEKSKEKDDEKKSFALVEPPPQELRVFDLTESEHPKETIQYDALTKTFYSKGMVISIQEFQKKIGKCRDTDFIISFEESILSKEVCSAIGALSNLQQLILQGCTFVAKDDERFTDIRLDFLSDTTGLQNLEISHTDEASTTVHLVALNTEILAALRVLDLSCSKLSPEFSELQSLFQLNRLILKGCANVDDRSLLQVAGIINLQFLDLSGCIALTPQGLKEFAQKRQQNITAKRVVTPITCLALDDMEDKFTDAHLVFLKHMQGLKVLSLQYSNHFLGSGLSHMPKTVQVLDLRECRNVRVEQLQRVLTSNMRSINVNGCPLFDAHSVQRLRDVRTRHNVTGEIVFTEATSSQEVDWLGAELRKLQLQTFDPEVGDPAFQEQCFCAIL